LSDQLLETTSVEESNYSPIQMIGNHNTLWACTKTAVVRQICSCSLLAQAVLSDAPVPTSQALIRCSKDGAVTVQAHCIADGIIVFSLAELPQRLTATVPPPADAVVFWIGYKQRPIGTASHALRIAEIQVTFTLLSTCYDFALVCWMRKLRYEVVPAVQDEMILLQQTRQSFQPGQS